MTVASALEKFKLDLVCVQEPMWDKGGMIKSTGLYFFYGKGNKNHQLEKGFFVHHSIVSGVERAEFVTDRMSFIVLRGRLCNAIVLNVYAPT